MRRSLAVAGVAAISLFVLTGFVAAQGQTQEPEPLKITGCLKAGPAEGEFHLENPEGIQMTVERLELIPAEDVNLTPHSDHRVEVTAKDVTEERRQAEEGDENVMYLQVSAVRHIAASCS